MTASSELDLPTGDSPVAHSGPDTPVAHPGPDSMTETTMPTTPIPDLASLAARPDADAPNGRLMLDAARAERFTGEIIIHAAPGGNGGAQIYFDNGLAYHAKRPNDPTLCERLLEAGVVTPAQIDRGVVRVGNIENLGRLFDRDPSVDRDAVMVVTELATDEVVTEVANRPAVRFAVTAYRHHRSGVHRWFVAPDDPTQLAPVGEVAQIDASVTSDLPTITAAPADDDVRIEWNAPLDHDDNVATPSAPTPALHSLDEAMLQSILDDDAEQAARGFDPDQADWAAAAPPVTQPLRPVDDLVTSAPEPAVDPVTPIDDEFQIVWPDGTEEDLPAPEPTPPVLATADDPIAIETFEPIIASPVASDPMAQPEMPAFDLDALQSLDSSDANGATDSADAADDFTFAMPTLALDADNVPRDEQPDDVVDAVRRALDAIESASAAKPALPSMTAVLPDLSPISTAPIDPIAPIAPISAASLTASAAVAEPVAPVPVADAPVTEPLPTETVESQVVEPVIESAAAPVSAPFGGFAPPTMDNSAEAVYARMAEAQQQPAAASAPASGVASVVFVDEDDTDGDERTGALRRLIGSLRRK